MVGDWITISHAVDPNVVATLSPLPCAENTVPPWRASGTHALAHSRCPRAALRALSLAPKLLNPCLSADSLRALPNLVLPWRARLAMSQSLRARGAAAARGCVERRIGHLSAVERGLRRSAAARVWVLIAATWCGDGASRPPLLVATPCLALAAAASTAASARTVLRKRCCSAGSCCSRRAPGSWSGFVRRRPRRRRRAWLGSQLKAGRAVLKSVVSDAHWSRTCLVACHKLLGSPSGRLDRADGVANRPTKKRSQLPIIDILALGS